VVNESYDSKLSIVEEVSQSLEHLFSAPGSYLALDHGANNTGQLSQVNHRNRLLEPLISILIERNVPGSFLDGLESTQVTTMDSREQSLFFSILVAKSSSTEQSHPPFSLPLSVCPDYDTFKQYLALLEPFSGPLISTTSSARRSKALAASVVSAIAQLPTGQIIIEDEDSFKNVVSAVRDKDWLGGEIRLIISRQ
jgi:hypothetical protein